jgi:hypothetical protein
MLIYLPQTLNLLPRRPVLREAPKLEHTRRTSLARIMPDFRNSKSSMTRTVSFSSGTSYSLKREREVVEVLWSK